jgi:hypothetical protein
MTIDEQRFRQTERLAQTQRRRLRNATITPQAPRGIRYSSGTVTWEEPADTSNVSHYNVYANSDSGPIERRVPKGQTRATGVYGDRVAVSSFNEATNLESRAVAANGKVLTGPPGAEYAPMVQALTAVPTDATGEAGTQLFRVIGTVTLPTATANYGGCDIVARIDGQSGLVFVAALTATDTSYRSDLFPKTQADQAWEVWALSYDSTRSNRNSIVAGTPKVTFTVAKASGTLDLARATSTSYDTIELEVTGGQFKVKQVNLRKAFNFNSAEFEIDSSEAFRVKALVADKIKTGILSVGDVAGGMVSKAAFFNSTGKVYGFIGDDSGSSGFEGAAFRELRAGGITDPVTGNFNPLNAKFVCDNSGTVTLKGSTLYLGPGTTGDLGKIFLYSQTSVYGFWGIADVGSTIPVTSQTNGSFTCGIAHTLTVGDYVRVHGNSLTAANGTWQVTAVPTSTTFTVSGITGSGSGGSAEIEIVGIWSQEARFAGSDPSTAKFIAKNSQLSILNATIKLTTATSELLLDSGTLQSTDLTTGSYAILGSGFLSLVHAGGGGASFQDRSWAITDGSGFTRGSGTYTGSAFELTISAALGSQKIKLTDTGANFLVPINFDSASAASTRTNLDVYSKAEVDTLLAGKSSSTHSHALAVNTTTVSSVPSSHSHTGSISGPI